MRFFHPHPVPCILIEHDHGSGSSYVPGSFETVGEQERRSLYHR